MPDPVEEPNEHTTVDDAEDPVEAEPEGQERFEVGHHRPTDG